MMRVCSVISGRGGVMSVELLVFLVPMVSTVNLARRDD